MFKNPLLLNQECFPTHPLPTQFPQGLTTRFNLGDRVQWIPLPSTDWGTIIGLEYEWSESLSGWQPRYCVLLDDDSPSRYWVERDWAWEWDLQPVAVAAARS